MPDPRSPRHVPGPSWFLALELYVQRLQVLDATRLEALCDALPAVGESLAQLRLHSAMRDGYSSHYVGLLIRHAELVAEVCGPDGSLAKAGMLLADQIAKAGALLRERS